MENKYVFDKDKYIDLTRK